MNQYTVSTDNLLWGGHDYKLGDTIVVEADHPNLSIMLLSRQLLEGPKAFTLEPSAVGTIEREDPREPDDEVAEEVVVEDESDMDPNDDQEEDIPTSTTSLLDDMVANLKRR
jgi:hypothetical protein